MPRKGKPIRKEKIAIRTQVKIKYDSLRCAGLSSQDACKALSEELDLAYRTVVCYAYEHREKIEIETTVED